MTTRYGPCSLCLVWTAPGSVTRARVRMRIRIASSSLNARSSSTSSLGIHLAGAVLSRFHPTSARTFDSRDSGGFTFTVITRSVPAGPPSYVVAYARSPAGR